MLWHALDFPESWSHEGQRSHCCLCQGSCSGQGPSPCVTQTSQSDIKRGWCPFLPPAVTADEVNCSSLVSAVDNYCLYVKPCTCGEMIPGMGRRVIHREGLSHTVKADGRWLESVLSRGHPSSVQSQADNPGGTAADSAPAGVSLPHSFPL